MSLSAHQKVGGAARVLVRIAKVIDDDVWKNPESVGPDRQLFWPRALKLRSERIEDGKSVAVRVDHIKSRDIGRVTSLSEVNDLDGRWVIAHCDVDETPGWLCRDTPASMSWCNLGPREPMPGGWTRHISGMVTEVSLLSPGTQPAEPGAKVWHIERTPAPTPKPTALELHLNRRVRWKETRARLVALGIDVSNYGPSPPLHPSEMKSTSAVAGEVTYGGPIIRRNIGQVLGVR